MKQKTIIELVYFDVPHMDETSILEKIQFYINEGFSVKARRLSPKLDTQKVIEVINKDKLEADLIILENPIPEHLDYNKIKKSKAFIDSFDFMYKNKLLKFIK